jgi:hypothetical protein
MCRSVPLALLAFLLATSGCSTWEDVPSAPCRETARIHGSVIGGSGPIENARVYVYSVDGNSNLQCRTDESGAYGIPVPPGEYFLWILPTDAPYQRIWYASPRITLDSGEADTLRIVEGGGDAKADFRLGSLLLFVRIVPDLDERRLYCEIEPDSQPQGYYGAELAGLIRDSIAVFDFAAVVPGRYVLKIRRSGTELYLPPTLERDRADRVEVSASETTFRSEALPSPARVLGRVTGAWTRFPAEQMSVYLHAPDSTVVSHQSLSPDYSFDLPVPAGGIIRVSVGSNQARSWLGGTGFRDATPFSVEPGSSVDVGEIPTCGIKCTLGEVPWTEPGHWAVTAMDEQGKNLDSVFMYNTSESWLPLPGPGALRLFISRLSDGVWRQQWYDREVDAERATRVVVTGPNELAEVSITLERGGSVSGVVVDRYGSPFDYSYLYASSGSWFEGYYSARSTDGTFTLEGLPDGDLILAVVAQGDLVYFPGTTDRDSAEAIPITDARDVTGLQLRVSGSTARPLRFVGVTICKPCHQTEAQGQIYAIWQASEHAHAYENLDSAQQQNGVCLACHTTGYGRALSPGRDRSDMVAVQCEACHGPGSEYKSMSVMRDPELAFELGLVHPDEATCLGCHRAVLPRECWRGSEHSPSFNYHEGLGEIVHRIPG